MSGMNIVTVLQEKIAKALKELYSVEAEPGSLTINLTKPEFEGEYTFVSFAFVKSLKRSPEQLGTELGEFLVKSDPDFFAGFNVIKGFVNLVIADAYWTGNLLANARDTRYGKKAANGQRVVIEYSSPNTNKPLHLGHLRNNFLGWSIAAITEANGFDAIKTCIANDRGIHICKSMVAWKQFANGATPQSVGEKGDHFVGDYYVRFGEEMKKQMEPLLADGIDKKEAEKQTPLMQEAQQMLIDWEAGKPEVIELWKEMNGWVYEGFDKTYKLIGSDFDKTYYESDTYLLGKKAVEEGLRKSVFTKRSDGSVWIDLTSDGLDEKIVQRKDGTAVYITQDIGLAELKQKEYDPVQSIYVVGDEQEYHFKVLKLICQKLGVPGSDGIYHLSYGMVELPTGRMKTREGTVVDADDIVEEMVRVAAEKTKELGKTEGFTENELTSLYHTLGLGALKFFLLRVDARKKMLFNPEESIDFHGFTGPFVQYSYARIKSVIRKEGASSLQAIPREQLLPLEKKMLVQLDQYPAIIEDALKEHNPSLLAIYAFNTAQLFNTFYAQHSIKHAETTDKKELRLLICEWTANVIASSLQLLGIDVPERM